MPTISSPRTDTKDGPRRGRRWPLLAGLVLVAVALAGAAAALHSVGGRDETTSFTATGVRELVVHHRAGRISLVPSPDGSVRVTTTRRWSLWAPRTGHAQAGGVLTLSGSCPPLVAASESPAAPSTSRLPSRHGCACESPPALAT
jgi:hypothetical protein